MSHYRVTFYEGRYGADVFEATTPELAVSSARAERVHEDMCEVDERRFDVVDLMTNEIVLEGEWS